MSATHAIIELDGLAERVAAIPDLTSHSWTFYDEDGRLDGGTSGHSPEEVGRRVADWIAAARRAEEAGQ